MQQPRATVTRIIRLENVPSASGMEVLDSCLYVVSDDSPLLFRFTLGYAPLAPVNLFKSAFSVGARIPKAEKPDLEALTLLRVNGELHLLAIGSGAAAPRERAFLISGLKNPEPTVREFSLKPLYELLRKSGKAMAGGLLNMEGIAATEANVHLVQRGVGQKHSTLITMSRADFERVVLGESLAELPFQVRELQAPVTENVSGGFSGITVFNNQFFLTASVEDTPNPVLDGKVLGSYLGYLKNVSAPLQLLPITDSAGARLPLKVESLVVVKQHGPHHFTALAATDNDLGQSELLELEVYLPAAQSK